jgi:hypothetical protein
MKFMDGSLQHRTLLDQTNIIAYHLIYKFLLIYCMLVPRVSSYTSLTWDSNLHSLITSLTWDSDLHSLITSLTWDSDLHSLITSLTWDSDLHGLGAQVRAGRTVECLVPCALQLEVSDQELMSTA